MQVLVLVRLGTRHSSQPPPSIPRAHSLFH